MGRVILLNSGALSFTATPQQVDGIFSDSFRSYHLVLDMSSGTGTTGTLLQVTSGGTPLTTGYTSGNYYARGTTVNFAGQDSGSSFGTGAIYSPNYSTRTVIDIFNPAHLEYTAISMHNFEKVSTDSYLLNAFCVIENTNAYDGFRIWNSSAVTTSGTYYLYAL